MLHIGNVKVPVCSGVTRRSFRQAAWDSLLNPEMINLVIVQPQYLSAWGLIEYIHYLRENAQNSRRYEQALWVKIVRPLSIISGTPPTRVATTGRRRAMASRIASPCASR